jgi:hypothetical protein
MSTPLPDVYAGDSRDGHTVLVANKKARGVLGKSVTPRLRWRTVNGWSPEYRAIEVEDGPGLQVMLITVHFE